MSVQLPSTKHRLHGQWVAEHAENGGFSGPARHHRTAQGVSRWLRCGLRTGGGRGEWGRGLHAHSDGVRSAAKRRSGEAVCAGTAQPAAPTQPRGPQLPEGIASSCAPVAPVDARAWNCRHATKGEGIASGTAPHTAFTHHKHFLFDGWGPTSHMHVELIRTSPERGSGRNVRDDTRRAQAGARG